MTPPAPQSVYRPDTAADTLGARLRTRLLEGDFSPGETISIRKMADAEGVSVIPARDALRGLVAEGALEFRDARTIAVPSPGGDTLGQLRYARLAVEGELAHRAWPQLVDLAHRLEEIDACVTQSLLDRDVAGYMRSNRALHFAIYERANAPVLLALAERLWLQFAPGMRIVCEAFNGQLPGKDYHVEAIETLRTGDRAGFRTAVEADIAQGMDTLLEHSHMTAAKAAKRGET